MDIHPETMISGTSSRITTSTRITEVTSFQVPNDDDLSGTTETQAYLLVQVDRIRRWIRQFALPPIDSDEIDVLPLLQFPLNLRIMCSNIVGYLHQQLAPFLLLQDIIPQDFWNEFIDTLTSNFKTILSGRKSGEVEILRVDVEVVNAEPYDAQRFLEHVSRLEMGEFIAAALAVVDPEDEDDDQSFKATPASQDSIDALKTMTYEQSCRRHVTSTVGDSDHAYDDSSDHCCSICLNEYLNASMIKWMPCSHVFHQECIEGWLKKKNTCPLCRFEMPTSQPWN